MKQITNEVFLLESTKGSYCYLVKARQMVLIDTGLPFVRRGLIKELKVNQIAPSDISHIILTHGDMDHIGNVGYLEKLTGAKVWASKEEIPFIMNEKPRAGFKRYFAKIMRYRKPNKIEALKDGDQVAGIEVVTTPGHTEGHISLIYKKVLFAGDLVEERDGFCVPYPPSWNWDTSALFKSIEKLKHYSFKWVCMAHGNPVLRDELFED